MDVRGSGGDAYGHNCLRAVVRQGVVPMIRSGDLDREVGRELPQQLHGEFGQLYREVERTLSS